MDSVLLRAFLETADAGSMSRAARQLGISQPSLSVQIQRLEQQLATVLFRRHGRGVALSDAGAALYPRARRILHDMRITVEAVRREGAESVNRLTIGAIPTVAPYLLPDALLRLREQEPDARVEIREQFSAALQAQLADGDVDVAIAALPFPFEHADTESLGHDRLFVAVPSSHPAARAGRITLAALRAAPAITLDRAHCLGEQIAGFCASHDVQSPVVCQSSQLMTVLELVGAGMGVSIVPAIAAARHNTPRCAYVPLVGHDLRREIVAVWRRGGERTRVASAFVECVRDAMRSR